MDFSDKNREKFGQWIKMADGILEGGFMRKYPESERTILVWLNNMNLLTDEQYKENWPRWLNILENLVQKDKHLRLLFK